MTGTALFIKHPRTICDLMRPHLLEEEREYEVVRTVYLSKIDYENFCTDLLADRGFLEENSHLCYEGDVLGCLLVTTRDVDDGVLVVPHNKRVVHCYVKYAAFFLPREAGQGDEI